jgi:hypothetical protein
VLSSGNSPNCSKIISLVILSLLKGFTYSQFTGHTARGNSGVMIVGEKAGIGDLIVFLY